MQSKSLYSPNCGAAVNASSYSKNRKQCATSTSVQRLLQSNVYVMNFGRHATELPASSSGHAKEQPVANVLSASLDTWHNEVMLLFDRMAANNVRLEIEQPPICFFVGERVLHMVVARGLYCSAKFSIASSSVL